MGVVKGGLDYLGWRGIGQQQGVLGQTLLGQALLGRPVARQEPTENVRVEFEDGPKGGVFHVGLGHNYCRYSANEARALVGDLVRAIREQRAAERAMAAEYGPRLAS